MRRRLWKPLQTAILHLNTSALATRGWRFSGRIFYHSEGQHLCHSGRYRLRQKHLGPSPGPAVRPAGGPHHHRRRGHPLHAAGRPTASDRPGTQEPFLFSQTIRENIAATRPQAPDATLRRAASIACVDEAITEFPEGYETVVGERGVTLSGGQKQQWPLHGCWCRKRPL